jgi:putative transposase
MFVAGTSTHKVGEVARTLLGVAPSATTISRLNQTLTQQFEAWRQRPLQQHWRILYLDGVHFSIRHGEKADSTIILTALGTDQIDVFTTETSCLTIVWATIQDIRLHKIAVA